MRFEGVGDGESVSAAMRVDDISINERFLGPRREYEEAAKSSRGRTRAVAQPPAKAPD